MASKILARSSGLVQILRCAQRWYRCANLAKCGEPLQLVQKKECTPHEGEILVNVECAGFNYADIQTIDGTYHLTQTKPFVPGYELAGTVGAVGKGVKSIKEGDRVLALKTNGGGAFAEQCILQKSDLVFPIPYSLDFETAASFAVCYGTAYIALRNMATQRQGSSVLVLSKRGTIGFATIDLAQNVFKAQVLAASDTEDKLERLRSAGVLSTFNYTSETFVRDVRKLMFGKGVDLIVDAVGGKAFHDSLNTLKIGGHVVSVGFNSGTVPSISLLDLHRLRASISGIWLGACTQREMEEIMQNLLELIDGGYLSIRTAKKYPLEQINDCIKDIKEDKVFGKPIITMR